MTNLRQVFAQLVASAAFVIAGWHLVQQRNSRLTVCLTEGSGIVLSRLAVKPCWLVVVAAVPGVLYHECKPEDVQHMKGTGPEK